MAKVETLRFTASVEKFAREVPERADEIKRGLAARILRGVVLKSPVDTGRFRGNWQVSGGAPAARELDRADKSGGETLAAGLADIETIAPETDIWIANNVPYAVPLENGYSGQAPAGVVALTIAEVSAK